MEIFSILYRQLSYDILNILFAYTEVFNSIKNNKRVKKVNTVNRMFKASITKVLRGVELNEYVDVFCISGFNEGKLEITATLISNNDSEYSRFFIDKFLKLKEFIINNNMEVVFDEKDKSYYLNGECGTFRYDDEEVLKVLYLENRLMGFLPDNNKLI